MSGVRIYDLAKELNLPNADVIALANELGEAAKSPSSAVADATAAALRARVAGDAPKLPIKPPPAPIKPAAPGGASSAPAAPARAVNIPDSISLREFADLIDVPAPTIQKKLMALGVLASLNQKLSPAVVTRIAKSFNVTATIVSGVKAPVSGVKTPDAPVSPTPATSMPDVPAAVAPPKVAVVAAKPRQRAAGPVARPPVVAVMGHVDHGKTSLLDAIRHAKVADGEFGGITQHIGAYQVEVDELDDKGQKRKVTFLDTPGHEAFTSMRARGAQVTDIAVLVVAADDGLMPQTLEAIQHAKAASVPLVVAINKIDKEGANPTRVLTQLAEHDVVPEAFGGDVQTVEVSAKELLGLDDLLEKILLVADAEIDPKADPTAPATATVIEAELDKGRGVVTTILVEQGTVKMGDAIVAGSAFGRIRAMIDDRGQRVKSAAPASPVVILGLGTLPGAGDRLEVVKDEKTARQMASERGDDARDEKLNARRPLTLEDLQRQLREGTKELNLIVKGDVQGSVEAVRQSLEKIEHPEVRVRFIATGVGPVGDSDVLLAAASQAIIFAFNVRTDPGAVRVAEAEHVEIREYKVIYDLIDEVKKSMAGLLDPIYEEVPLGVAEVRAIFRLPRAGGVIAGSYILEGKVVRNAKVRVKRAGKVVAEGEISTLRREKDDAREVAQGFECGILVPGYEPLEEDRIECYEMKKTERTL